MAFDEENDKKEENHNTPIQGDFLWTPTPELSRSHVVVNTGTDVIRGVYAYRP